MSLPRLPLILIVLPLLVLAFVSDAKAQVVEAVKEYTITVEQGGGSCETVQTPGDLCGDGMDIVFMGDGVTGRRLFAAPAPLSQMTWNDGSTSWLTRLNRYDPVNGAVNTSGIAAADANRNLGGRQVHLAATACHNLSHGGYDDWYLPALQEAHSLYLNRSAFPTNPGTIWTSTERDEVHAYSYNLGTGAVTATEDKWTSRNVQCVRSDPGAVSSAVYAGESVSGGALYVMDTLLAPTPWNDGSTSWLTLLNRDDPVNGVTNTAGIASADANRNLGGTQGHVAAAACANLNYKGSGDWYLPSVQEAAVLYRNRASLPVSSGVIWTSTERDEVHAYSYNLGTGAANPVEDKWNSRSVLCVRKDPSPLSAPEDCDPVTTLGATCGGGDLVFAGETPSGGALYTTSFSMSSVTWNDGSSSWLTLLNRDDPVNGATNTAGIAAADANRNLGGTQGHLAAETCANMSYGGYDDWHLPSVQEAAVMYRNRASLPVSSGVIWTSTERDEVHAYSYNLGTGVANPVEDKWNLRQVQCVRSVPGYSTPGVGSVLFVGETPSGGALYTTSFSMSSVTWNDGSSSWLTLLNRDDPVNGATNTAGIASADANRNLGGTQGHLAAETCANMSYGGYDDWYLPSVQEAAVMYRNRASLPVSSGVIWTSTERDEVHAYSYNLGTGAANPVEDKWNLRQVQCVRRDPSFVFASQTCDPDVDVGSVCGNDSDIVRAGSISSGHPLFTTVFPMSPVTWNDGSSSWLTLLNRNDPVNGAANTAGIASADANRNLGGTQGHLAAETCANMTYAGRSDWYLPSVQEAATLYQNRGSLPVSSGVIWTSTEQDETHAQSYNLGTGAVTNLEDKWNLRGVQCVFAQTEYAVAQLPDMELSTGPVGMPWSADLSVDLTISGGDSGSRPQASDFSWSVISGSLPPGLSLNADTGVLSGTPQSVGSATFTVEVAHAESGLFAQAAIKVDTNPGSGVVRLYTDVVPSLYGVSADRLTMTRTGSDTDYRRWMKADVRIPNADQTYYWEVALSGGSSAWNGYVGIVSQHGDGRYAETLNPVYGDSIAWRGNGTVWGDGSEGNGTVGSQLVSAGSSWTYGNGDVLMLAFNAKSGKFWIGKNGIWRNSPTSSPTYDVNGSSSDFASSYAIPSFQGRDGSGQSLSLRSSAAQFSYPVPAGALPLADLIDMVPNPMTFTDVTGVEPGTVTVSNTVTIWGINTATPISVSEGVEYQIGTATISIGGTTITWGQWTSETSEVTSQKRVRIRLNSGTFGETVTGNLYTGGVMTALNVTTRDALLQAEPFSFAHAENRPLGQLTVSDPVTLSGPDIPDTVSITGPSAEYSLNGGAYTSAEGMAANGDVISLRMPASSSYSETVAATLNVGPVSSTWSVTTSPGCGSVSVPGQICDDGQIVFAGDSPAGGAMFTTTFTLAAAPWNDGQTRYTTTNIRNPIDGAANTSTLSAADANSSLSGTQVHEAARACANLVSSGYEDWYLPSVQEVTVLYRNRGVLPVSPGQIWTSTEKDFDRAHSYNVGTGAVTSSEYKYMSRAVQCVRRDPAPLEDPGLVFVGDAISGGALYTTPFTLAAVSWNDGDSRYSTTNTRDPISGAANTSTLNLADANVSDGGTQLHLAAASCARMSYGGHDDWYLPSVQEATVLYRNRGRLPVSPGQIWTSTEKDFDRAHSYNVGTGAVTSSEYKYMSRAVQCVRKDPAPLEEPGLVFVGDAISGGALYTTPFTLAAVSWNDGDSRYSTTNTRDPISGAANTSTLNLADANVSDGGTQLHLAAASCARMSYGGHDDWYLPSVQEATVLYRNRGRLPVSPGQIWTSTEKDFDRAHSYNVGTGAVTSSEDKRATRAVQCVRKDPAPLEAPGLVFVGDSVSGGALYTTPFTLAAVSWNDGDYRWVTTNRRDPIDGAANTAGLNTADANSNYGGTQTHLAAASCARMSYGGYDDWYLPASDEMGVLFQNKGSLPVSSGQFWTSTETDYNVARSYNLGTGAVTVSEDKRAARLIQCVRR